MQPCAYYRNVATRLMARASNYMQAFAECMNTGTEEVKTALRGLNESKWKVLLTLSTASPSHAGLAKARAIAIDMVDALQDPLLAKQVEESRQGLSSRLPEQERQMLVARAVVAVQAEVIADMEFEATPVLRRRRSRCMDHAGDAVVAASIAAATTNLYARAGINLQQALQGQMWRMKMDVKVVELIYNIMQLLVE